MPYEQTCVVVYYLKDSSPRVEILPIDKSKEDVKDGGEVDGQGHGPLHGGEHRDHLLLLVEDVQPSVDVLLVPRVHIFR